MVYFIKRLKEYNLKEYLDNVKINSEYVVNHYATFTSSAGTRELKVSYTIRNGVPISCNGTYVAYMTDGTYTYDCNSRRVKDLF